VRWNNRIRFSGVGAVLDWRMGRGMPG
jgi:hypothetical protein